MNDISWPLAVIDFEASGMSRFSFPIEVGFARWRGLDAPIESWSALIRPDYDWTYWSEEAEAIHGIARKDLKAGLVAREVCRRLNAELLGAFVCCDGLAYDAVWLSQLYEAGNIKPTFQLQSMIKLYHWGNPAWRAGWARTRRFRIELAKTPSGDAGVRLWAAPPAGTDRAAMISVSLQLPTRQSKKS